MTLKMETSVRRGDTSRLLPLLVKFSSETWEKLPNYAQTYISREDLIAEGRNHLVTYVVKMYKGERYKNAQFITYAYKALENFYCTMLQDAYRHKRNVRVLSGDQQVMYGSKPVTLFEAIASANIYNLEDTMLKRYDAEKAFLKVYALASTHLRKHLISWCIQPTATKYKLTNGKFIKARREFRAHRLNEILTQEHVAVIQSDAIARSRITLEIVKNPKNRTIRRGRILERELLPALVDPEDQEFFDIALG
jgi:hypothetical protein